jgi:D-sedoheptulose 7-phosphate isomerase
MIYADWIKKFNNYLENTEVISNGSKLSIGEGFDQLVDISLRAKQNNNTMFIAGNGASASLAAHLATDLWVHAGVKTSTFHEINQVTALANDFGYEEVYSRPLEMFSQAGDVLIITG